MTSIDIVASTFNHKYITLGNLFKMKKITYDLIKCMHKVEAFFYSINLDSSII